MKKKIIVVLVTLVLIAAIGIPWYMMHKQSVEQEEIALNASMQISFVQRYGTGKELIQVSQSDKIYVFYWKDNDNIRATLWLDGLWIDVANTPIIEIAPTPTP